MESLKASREMSRKCWEEQRHNMEDQLSRLESKLKENPRYLERIRDQLSKKGIIFNSGTVLSASNFHSKKYDKTDREIVEPKPDLRLKAKSEVHVFDKMHVQNDEALDGENIAVGVNDETLDGENVAADVEDIAATCQIQFEDSFATDTNFFKVPEKPQIQLATLHLEGQALQCHYFLTRTNDRFERLGWNHYLKLMKDNTNSFMKMLADYCFDGGSVMRTNEHIAGDFPFSYRFARFGTFQYHIASEEFLKLTKSALQAALEALAPESLFGLVTFSHKVGSYDVQGLIPIVKNIFIPQDAEGTLPIELEDVMLSLQFLAPAETCKDRITSTLETLKPTTSWERAHETSQELDGVLMGGRGFGVAMETFCNHFGSEYENAFALAGVFVFLVGPPDHGSGQLDTRRYASEQSMRQVTFHNTVVVPPKKLSNSKVCYLGTANGGDKSIAKSLGYTHHTLLLMMLMSAKATGIALAMSSRHSLNVLLLSSLLFDPWGQGSSEGGRNVITRRVVNNEGNKDKTRFKEHVKIVPPLLKNHYPKFISLCVDDKFQKGLKGVSKEDVEVTIDKIRLLFSYMQGKEVFEQYYKHHLAKFLSGKIVSELLQHFYAAIVEVIVSHPSASVSSGKLFTWGNRNKNRLGHGGVEDRKTLTLVEGLKDRHVKYMACDLNYSAVICLKKWISGAAEQKYFPLPVRASVHSDSYVHDSEQGSFGADGIVMTQDEVRGEMRMKLRLKRNIWMHARIVSYSTWMGACNNVEIFDPGGSFIMTATLRTKDVQQWMGEEFQRIEYLRTSTRHKKIVSARHDFISFSASENKLKVFLRVLESNLAKAKRTIRNVWSNHLKIFSDLIEAKAGLTSSFP